MHFGFYVRVTALGSFISYMFKPLPVDDQAVDKLLVLELGELLVQ
jgi:hypothetical protein